MLKHHLTTAWRNLRKHKLYALINLSGLTAGVTVAVLIGLWIWDELSWDRVHGNYNRLAQVMDVQTVDGVPTTSDANAIPLAEELRKTFPDDLRGVALFYPLFTHTVTVGERKLPAPGSWVQADLPEMLTLHMLKGRRDALRDPSNVLLTRSLANRLFGSADPMNKIIKLDNMATVKVGGVYEDLPENSTFHDAQLLLSWDKALTVMDWFKGVQGDWGVRYWKIYVQLSDRAEIGKVNARIRDMMKVHTKDSREVIFLHPMEKWHLYGKFENGMAVGGRVGIVRLVGLIGGCVLLLACINFMNLSTARSERRAREVGIRKAIGSLRGQLIRLFIGESMLVVFFAFVLAVVAAGLCLPGFGKLAGKELAMPWGSLAAWGVMVLSGVVTGLVAGSYPAFYLSGFRPVKVLKGDIRAGRGVSLARKLLVVVQFVVSVTLIISTMVVRRQIDYAQERSVGYMREGLITVTMNSGDIYGVPYNTLRDELRRTGMVADMTKSSSPATEAPWTANDIDWKGKAPGANPEIGVVIVTYDYGKTMGWRIKEGRDFSRSFTSDTGGIVLNQAAVRLMGLAKPVGEVMRLEGRKHTVIGVAEDMVMASPYMPVKPTVFWLNYDAMSLNSMTVRLAPGVPVHKALAATEGVFKRLAPGGAFEYKFIDEEYARKFSDEVRIGRIVTVFAVLAIFISCLGLFGLASFVAEQRTKEIGIRKVLGAPVFGIWKMLTREFLVLVLVASVVAMPLAWYVMQRWLQQYAYRAGLSWWIFVLSAVGAVLITLLTVGYQAVRAAMMDPVKSLRSE
ncbi:ABC transporter permease [Flavitalea sp. BT771]|uniref:ABC transporter permease n=1 Tax=Flavitalea sp. BT771 TaxID=3063329 RepID=UPI0026E34789|nr:ABC transporter permease [Flavitalea sp. BT771]MDO6434922.1 ABC transporter permease [Flavitalea sp. BT771]MDV6223822.1 ABC transporter permease [Flavitalea sp. BT771]